MGESSTIDIAASNFKIQTVYCKDDINSFDYKIKFWVDVDNKEVVLFDSKIGAISSKDENGWETIIIENKTEVNLLETYFPIGIVKSCYIHLYLMQKQKNQSDTDFKDVFYRDYKGDVIRSGIGCSDVTDNSKSVSRNINIIVDPQQDPEWSESDLDINRIKILINNTSLFYYNISLNQITKKNGINNFKDFCTQTLGIKWDYTRPKDIIESEMQLALENYFTIHLNGNENDMNVLFSNEILYNNSISGQAPLGLAFNEKDIISNIKRICVINVGLLSRIFNERDKEQIKNGNPFLFMDTYINDFISYLTTHEIFHIIGLIKHSSDPDSDHGGCGQFTCVMRYIKGNTNDKVPNTSFCQLQTFNNGQTYNLLVKGKDSNDNDRFVFCNSCSKKIILKKEYW